MHVLETLVWGCTFGVALHILRYRCTCNTNAALSMDNFQSSLCDDVLTNQDVVRWTILKMYAKEVKPQAIVRRNLRC